MAEDTKGAPEAPDAGTAPEPAVVPIPEKASGKTVLVSRRIATPGSYVELRGKLLQVTNEGTVEVPDDITPDEEKALTEK